MSEIEDTPVESSLPGDADGRRIAVCGVRYSPNLGDGVISDCLGWMIRHLVPNAIPIHTDLAGRSSFGEETISSRRQKLKLLLALPQFAQDAIVRMLLGKKIRATLLPNWLENLDGCEAAIIGGGQLLSDSDLNFPLKIRGLMSGLRQKDLSCVFYACGVTYRGGAGASILGQCLNDSIVKAIFLRDERSIEAAAGFKNALGVSPSSKHAYDPAIHVSDAYADRLTNEKEFDVGVNFTDPVNMTYSSGRELPYVATLDATMSDVVSALADSGQRVALFTNGATEDEEFLSHCEQLYSLTAKPSVVRLPRPIQPAQLVQSIDRMQTVIAHRLHTNIIAFGLRIPSVGLEWSQKVPHFFQLVNRQGCLVEKDAMTSQTVLRRHASLKDFPVGESFLVQMKKDSLGSLRHALGCLDICHEENG